MMYAELIQAKDYRHFLLLLLKSKKEKVNFSALTRKAGFSSRSFIKEVLDGKRALTNRSLVKFVKAFNLVGSEKKYFECLVALEEPQIELGFRDSAHIHSEMAKIRNKWLQKQESTFEFAKAQQAAKWAFKINHIAEVYAALGDLDSGASLLEIQMRTGFSDKTCKEVLHFLQKQSAIRTKENRYYVTNTSLDVFGLGDDDGFRSYYREALSRLHRKANRSLQSEEEFFFHSAFSVSRARLPEFKEQLKNLVTSFLDEAQDDRGDRVAKLTLGLHL